jgi:hypothetical protein
MFSSLLESVNVRLFQSTETYSGSDRIKVLLVYKTFRLSKEKKLYVMKGITRNSFSAWECKRQHDDENAVCYLT